MAITTGCTITGGNFYDLGGNFSRCWQLMVMYFKTWIIFINSSQVSLWNAWDRKQENQWNKTIETKPDRLLKIFKNKKITDVSLNEDPVIKESILIG